MTRLRVVSYAINGRGMGHLVRQLAILRQVRRVGVLAGVKVEAWVLTSSEADTLARREGVPALKLPSKAMLRDAGLEPARYLAILRGWVLNAIAGLQPDLLVVDTFPGGSAGELVAALELAPHRVLVARRTRVGFEDPYASLVPLYGRVVVPGEGAGPILLREGPDLLPREEARRALGVPDGARAVWLSLGGGGDEGAAALLPDLTDRLRARGWHVVVAAGPLYTGPERRGPGVTWLDRYAAAELLGGVDAAVSAGGYNGVHELMHAGVPTVFLPRDRIADDQEERARRVVEAGAGRLARTLDEVADLLEDPGSAEAARALSPGGGALAAALEVLAGVLPAGDLAAARKALTPSVVAALRGLDPAGEARLLEVARLFGPQAERFLAAAQGASAPLDVAVPLAQALARKFPGAPPAEVVAAWETLAPVWGRFGDWMGAMSLLRAVPAQRGYAPTVFAADVAAWLSREDDLFDALRAFTHLEGGGARPVPDVLRELAR